MELPLEAVFQDGGAVDGWNGLVEIVGREGSGEGSIDGPVKEEGYDGPEAAEERTEVVGGFGFGEDAVGIEAVGDAIGRGTQFSLGCFGAVGERPVGLRGSNSHS